MNDIIFTGAIAVKAALQAKKRTIIKVYFAKDKIKKDSNLQFIWQLAQDRQVETVLCDHDLISEITEERNHGGVCAKVGDYQGIELSTICQKENAYLALIYGVEDPYNIGYMMRSLYASGCQGIILNTRKWQNSQGIITRSSAGASELIDFCFVSEIAIVLQHIQVNNITLLCADRKNALNLYDYKFPKSFIICFGGEKRGLPSEITQASSQNLYIPYANQFKNALNASSATSIFAFEIYRQKR